MEEPHFMAGDCLHRNSKKSNNNFLFVSAYSKRTKESFKYVSGKMLILDNDNDILLNCRLVFWKSKIKWQILFQQLYTFVSLMNLICHDFTKVNVAFFYMYLKRLCYKMFSHPMDYRLSVTIFFFCSLPVLHAHLTNINFPVFFKILAEWKVTKTSREGRDTTS